jgi:hypothetical protein
MDSRRTEAFSDGVFAVASTVLVFSLLEIGSHGLTPQHPLRRAARRLAQLFRLRRQLPDDRHLAMYYMFEHLPGRGDAGPDGTPAGPDGEAA